MADQNKTYRHIHIRGLGKAPRSFRAWGGSSEKPIRPVNDRGAHARQLREELDSATEKFAEYASEQSEIGLPAKHQGMPLTVLGRPEIELKVGKGRPTRHSAANGGVHGEGPKGGAEKEQGNSQPQRYQ